MLIRSSGNIEKTRAKGAAITIESTFARLCTKNRKASKTIKVQIKRPPTKNPEKYICIIPPIYTFFAAVTAKLSQISLYLFPA